jgi:hypothetical protein
MKKMSINFINPEVPALLEDRHDLREQFLKEYCEKFESIANSDFRSCAMAWVYKIVILSITALAISLVAMTDCDIGIKVSGCLGIAMTGITIAIVKFVLNTCTGESYIPARLRLLNQELSAKYLRLAENRGGAA